MSNITEDNNWTPGIYQLEEGDVVQGGPNGIDNLQAKQLAARTQYLKALAENLGNNKQPLDATLTAIAALVTAADKIIYATGVDTFATSTLTAFARSLLDDTTAAAARTTLGLGGAATLSVGTAAGTVAAGDHDHTGFQPSDATLSAIAALVTAADKIIYATGVDTFATATLTAFARSLLDDANAAAARTTLGLGGAATLSVGTAAGTVAAGDHDHTGFQPSDATLSAIAALVTAADKLIYATGVDTFATATLTAFARSLLDDTTAAGARSTLGLGSASTLSVGTVAGTVAAGDHGHDEFQPLDNTLSAIAALVTAADKLIYSTAADTFSTATLTAFARSLLDDADAATARATLGIVASTQAVAGISKMATQTEGDAGSSTTTAMSPAVAKASLGTHLSQLGVGAKGTYAFLGETSTTQTLPGATKSGASLRYTGYEALYTHNAADITIQSQIGMVQSPNTPAGTWMACGVSCGLGYYGATLWQRIA